VDKIRERIARITTFKTEADWWRAEIRAGRIVNSKTRKQIRANTIDAYGDMSSRYGKQLTEDVEFREQWSAKVGLDFELPSNLEPSFVCATCATNSEKETVAA